MIFYRFFSFKSSHFRDSTRGLMVRAAEHDLDTLSNMSGDTLLLEDVSDSEVRPSESQNVLLSQSLELPSVELQTAEQQAVSVPGNTTSATAVADNTSRVNESSRGYRGEHYLSRFEWDNFHPYVTPDRPCTAYFQASFDVVNTRPSSKVIYCALNTVSSAPSLHRAWVPYLGPGFSIRDHWTKVRDSFCDNCLNDLFWLIALRGV